jgi:hypothetical protein
MMFKILLFSNVVYICPYKFCHFYLPFLWKIEWKIKLCAVKIIHFININRTLGIIFMIFLGKKLYHLSLNHFNFVKTKVYWNLLISGLWKARMMHLLKINLKFCRLWIFRVTFNGVMLIILSFDNKVQFFFIAISSLGGFHLRLIIRSKNDRCSL